MPVLRVARYLPLVALVWFPLPNLTQLSAEVTQPVAPRARRKLALAAGDAITDTFSPLFQELASLTH
jgi:hypothetical protein